MTNRKQITTAIKIVVSVSLLTLILSRVDLHAVWANLKQTQLTLFICGTILGYIVQILIGAFRYQYMLRKICDIRIRYPTLLKDYWEGMFLGYFVPAGLGWDVYRIATTYRRAGKLPGVTFTVFGEKVMGLIATVVMLGVVYPFALPHMTADTLVLKLAKIIYVCLAAGGLALILYLVFPRHAHRVLTWTEEVAVRFVNSAAQRLKIPVSLDKPGQLSSLVQRYLSLPHLGATLSLTVLIRVASAVGGMCLFKAMGYDVPFIANLFAVPALFFIFMLPISFGSIGVREGAMILIYGLFGVPATVALACSFLGLASLLITLGIGGLIHAASPVAATDSNSETEEVSE